MTRPKPTIADLRARKGKGQLTMLRVMSLEEAAAAEMAGIDIVSVPDEIVTHPRYREVAPTLFSMTGRTHLEAGTRDDYLRWACKVMLAGADAAEAADTGQPSSGRGSRIRGTGSGHSFGPRHARVCAVGLRRTPWLNS
mgnify:CR=1 FL=1